MKYHIHSTPVELIQFNVSMCVSISVYVFKCVCLTVCVCVCVHVCVYVVCLYMYVYWESNLTALISPSLFHTVCNESTPQQVSISEQLNTTLAIKSKYIALLCIFRVT